MDSELTVRGATTVQPRCNTAPRCNGARPYIEKGAACTVCTLEGALLAELMPTISRAIAPGLRFYPEGSGEDTPLYRQVPIVPPSPRARPCAYFSQNSPV